MSERNYYQPLYDSEYTTRGTDRVLIYTKGTNGGEAMRQAMLDITKHRQESRKAIRIKPYKRTLERIFNNADFVERETLFFKQEMLDAEKTHFLMRNLQNEFYFIPKNLLHDN